jgi:glycosyltransferase involved in cell wall biosynthesis
MIKISVITSLYNCSKYLPGYFEAVEKIPNKEECEFLLLHNAPQTDEIEIINRNIEGKAWFRYIVIKQQEGLYVTWNRGVSMSKGEYCAVWNVDDIRFPDSLYLQAKILDENKKCGLVTGYVNGTDVYGELGNRFYKHDIMIKDPLEVFRSCLVGCFPMWRKSVHETIGYFDEQFICVSDFDFQIRVAMHFEFRCVPQSLGTYLENDPNKISSNRAQGIENNLIYIRYGAYENIILHKMPASLKRYNKNALINFGKTYDLKNEMPFNFRHRIEGVGIAILRWPIHIARDIYHIMYPRFRTVI